MVQEDARPGLCWYCGEASLAVGDPPEHVIPAAIGGTLTTDRVCAACNKRAGKLIDQPFLGDWFIAMDRILLDVRDGRRSGTRPIRPPDGQAAHLPDGTPVDLVTNDGPWSVRMRSGIEREGAHVRIRAADQEEFNRLWAKLARKLEGEGITLGEPPTPKMQEIDGPIEVENRIDGLIWLRMAAKVSLAALSLVLDESWLDTSEAAKYRSWLWDDDPKNPDGSPALGLPGQLSEDERRLSRPPEHLVYFVPLERDATALTVLFFGRRPVHCRIELEGQPHPQVGWRTGPKGPARQFTFDELLLDVVRSYDEGRADGD